MVAPLGPGKFYGTSLPRPRIYTDIKFNHERIDPPISVVDPLLSWANEAHWSMGGLCTKRLRLQGRIEGNISKLRAQNEKSNLKASKRDKPYSPVVEKFSEVLHRDASPPPAPVAGNRKRRSVALIEEEEEEEVNDVVVEKEKERKKKPARKLINEFNEVATSPIRRSPRTGNKVNLGEVKSRGGSFASKMKKASEGLMSFRNSENGVPFVSAVHQARLNLGQF